MICPYCSSTKINKGGHLKSGVQRYVCRECGKFFSDVTVVKPKVVRICPTCYSTNTVKCGKTKNGQRYLCKECGKKFSILVELVGKPRGKVYNGIVCPSCGHNRMYKSGFAPSREQYYRCVECNRTFLVKGQYKHLSEKDKKLIVMYALNLGVPRKDIAKSWNITDRTVYDILKKFKEELKNDV